jgi:signal transduction histidine kinase
MSEADVKQDESLPLPLVHSDRPPAMTPPTESAVPPSRRELDLDGLTMGHGLKLEELVDRKNLGELTRSFYVLFGIPIRIFSESGALLADSSEEQEICRLLNTLNDGRLACAKTIASVKRASLDEGEVMHPCFTGAAYFVVAIEYDRRRLGRLVLGPYLPLEVKEPPGSLLSVDKALDPNLARDLLPKMPRARAETVRKVADHVARSLDLILFAGHKALLTSQMHLAAVRESYRELEEKNRELSIAVDRLRELDRLKSNFLATVSHELRTPLTSIIGYSEMLVEGIAGPLADEQREFVGTIREKGEQLLSLIISLLDLSKLESGTMTLKRGETAIGAVVGEVVSTLLPTARKKGVKLEQAVDKDIPPLSADSEKLRQVFLNLTENAIKFTPAGGTVRLSASAVSGASPDEDDGAGFVLFAGEKQVVEVRVADTGIGIPESSRDKVFDPFYQVDSSSTREYGGTGLGLSIVKRLVEAHQGSIRIEPNVPRGTVFVVTLPLPNG